MIEKQLISAAPKEPEMRIIAKATCTFMSGETKDLYVTRLSPFDMFIMALRPPPVGTPLTVNLCPFGLSPLPPIEVRVSSTKLDHADPGGCGFGATMAGIDKTTLDAVIATLDALGLSYEKSESRPHPERRADLRVRIDYEATVIIPGRRLHARMVDISLSGARLEFDADGFASDIAPGTLFSMGINGAASPEGLSLKAEVVHRVTGEKTVGVGVRFLDVDERLSSKIEALILYKIGSLNADGTSRYSRAS